MSGTRAHALVAIGLLAAAPAAAHGFQITYSGSLAGSGEGKINGVDVGGAVEVDHEGSFEFTVTLGAFTIGFKSESSTPSPSRISA